jgi:hypothetical protein
LEWEIYFSLFPFVFAAFLQHGDAHLHHLNNIIKEWVTRDHLEIKKKYLNASLAQ